MGLQQWYPYKVQEEECHLPLAIQGTTNIKSTTFQHEEQSGEM